MPTKRKSTSPEPAEDTEAVIRARAYHLWEADGRPDGRAEHYWQLAQASAPPPPAKAKRAGSAKAAAPAPEKKPRRKTKAS